MNDQQILDQIAETDAYAAASPMPTSAWTRSDALLEVKRRIDMQTQQRRTPAAPPTRQLGVLVAVVAFVVVVAGALIVTLVAPGADDIEPAAPSTTSGAPTTTVTPSNTLGLPSAWQRVGAPVMTPVAGLFDMAETSSGLVAVGFDPGEGDFRQNGAILTSIDGVTWVRAAEDDPALNLGTVLLYGVTEGGPGIVAVGAGCEDDTESCAPHPTVWTSVDGTTWDRSSADPEVFGERGAMLDVVATEHGLVAAGGFYSTKGGAERVEPTVWLSRDGLEWERVWQGEPFDYTSASDITAFQALAVGPGGRIVGTGTAVDDHGNFVGAIWTSTDGRTWERIDHSSEVFASNTDSDVAIHDVAAGPSGFVAVGTDGGSEVAIWHSSDGLRWTRAATADHPFEYIGSLGSVDALGTGWVIAGPHGFSDMTGGTVTLWTSPDGLVWDRVQSIDAGYAMAVVATDTGTAVAGAMTGLDNFYAAVWAGPNFDPSAPPPDPGPTQPPVQKQEEVVEIPEEGLSCEDLVARGYRYIETVGYWVWYNHPGDLDPQSEGIPCSAYFPDDQIEGIFGGPGSLAVEIITDYAAGTFSATGPAVDDGLICAKGSISFSGNPEAHPSAIWRWEDRHTCDDGSGTFIVGVNAFHEDPGIRIAGVWDISAGTDTYKTLTGGGGVQTTYVPDESISIGWVWPAHDE